jgi:single-strand DNA-binding protein
MGRLSTDVEYKATATGMSVARFNFAVNRRFKKEGEPDADFFTCVAFGKIAETFQKCNVGKGTKLLIEAEVRNNNYEKDGVKHYGTQIVVNSFEFCESKASNDAEYAPTSTPTQPASSSMPVQDDINGFMPIDDDDLPF